MKIGLCAWSFTAAHREAGRQSDPFTAEGLAQIAVEQGLQSIECSPGFLADLPPEKQEELKEFLAARSLGLVLDTGGHTFAQDTGPLRFALEVAHRFGAPVVRTTVSDLLEGDRRRLGREGCQAHLQALVEPLRGLMPLAEEYGIPVGVENHQDLCSWELVWLCEQVRSPMLGVTMDVANALAVGETPLDFAGRVLPFLKHVHLKDYTVHPTPSGYCFKRCALGQGVVDWPAMLALFDQEVPKVWGCIELGASVARHIRILEQDYWAAYPPRPLAGVIDALRALHRASRPPEEDWRTPHERGEDAAACAAYELEQIAASARYIKGIAR